MQKLLNISQVCDITGLKPPTIYGMVMRGEIPVLKISGRCLRFRITDLEKWLDGKFHDVSVVKKLKKPSKKRGLKHKEQSHSMGLADKMLSIAKKEVGI
jgi:excisionase family DNA binding protein